MTKHDQIVDPLKLLDPIHSDIWKIICTPPRTAPLPSIQATIKVMEHLRGTNLSGPEDLVVGMKCDALDAFIQNDTFWVADAYMRQMPRLTPGENQRIGGPVILASKFHPREKIADSGLNFLFLHELPPVGREIQVQVFYKLGLFGGGPIVFQGVAALYFIPV